MERNELLLTVTKGDKSAADFLSCVADIAHVWDDLIDQDHEVDPESIHWAFTTALITLPRNAFYQRHFEWLNPLLLSSINNWRVANSLESGDDEADKRIAFISRSSYVDLITQVAFIIGGSDWVRQVGATIRRFVHSEGWEGYLANLETEKAARASHSAQAA